MLFVAALRLIPHDRWLPYYSAHGVLRVWNSTFSGTMVVQMHKEQCAGATPQDGCGGWTMRHGKPYGSVRVGT